MKRAALHHDPLAGKMLPRQKARSISVAGLSASGWEDWHHVHVPASAFGADKIEQLGNVNEDRRIRQSQLIEGQLRPMAATVLLAIDCEARFASRSRLTDGLCRSTACHAFG